MKKPARLRDMIQNHMLQLLCLVAMEPPYSLEPNVVRNAKMEVLRCLRPIVGRMSSDTPSAPNMPKEPRMDKPVPGIGGKKASIRTQPRKPTWRSKLRRELALVGRAVLSSNRENLAQARQ